MSLLFSVKRFRGHRDSITYIDVPYEIRDHLHQISTVITGSNDKTIRLWDVQTGKTSQCVTNSSQIKESIGSISMYDKFIYFSNGNSLSVYDTRMKSILLTQSEIHIENVCDDEISTTAITKDGKCIAFGSDDGYLHIFDRLLFEPKMTLTGGHTTIIGAIAFREVNFKMLSNELVTGGFDCKLIVWDYINGNIKSE